MLGRKELARQGGAVLPRAVAALRALGVPSHVIVLALNRGYVSSSFRWGAPGCTCLPIPLGGGQNQGFQAARGSVRVPVAETSDHKLSGFRHRFILLQPLGSEAPRGSPGANVKVWVGLAPLGAPGEAPSPGPPDCRAASSPGPVPPPSVHGQRWASSFLTLHFPNADSPLPHLRDPCEYT